MWVREITKNKSTAYRYLERYTDPLTGKYKTVSVTRNKNNVRSQKDAQLELTKIIEQRLKHYSTKQLENLTFHDACDEWLEHYKTHSGSKPTTIKEKKRKVMLIQLKTLLIAKYSSARLRTPTYKTLLMNGLNHIVLAMFNLLLLLFVPFSNMHLNIMIYTILVC